MSSSNWRVGPDVWADFTKQHPVLGYQPGKWQFHNFLRSFRDELIEADAIRKAKGRFWIAHSERFAVVAFDCATGALGQVLRASGRHQTNLGSRLGISSLVPPNAASAHVEAKPQDVIERERLGSDRDADRMLTVL